MTKRSGAPCRCPQKHGGPCPERVDVRFMRKVEPVSSGCWLWRGGADVRGYGTFWREGKGHPAHRVSYELHIGPIPDGLHLDHLCRTPRCVRPDHLEPVTPRENLMRSSTTQAAINAAKTHCVHGHLLAGDNLHIDPEGKRRCNQCRRERVRRWRARKARLSAS